VKAGAVAVRVAEGALPVVLAMVVVVLWALVVELLELVVLDSSGALATETVLVEDPPQPPIRARHAASAPAIEAIRFAIARDSAAPGGLAIARALIALRIFAAPFAPPGDC
jgi:hypothetical protein